MVRTDGPGAGGTRWRRRRRPPLVVLPGRSCIPLRVAGPLDDEAVAQAAEDLEEPVRRVHAGDVVLLHLDECDFVNVRGLRLLVGLDDELRRRGARLVLIDPCRSLRTLLGLLPEALVVATVPPRAA